MSTENLEERLVELESEHEVILTRLKNLERAIAKDRWHATYNAVTPALIALQMPLAMVREEATKFADMTHGPLW